ncbi:DNA adenine methylase [Thermoanaerobacterium sp. DL9XJH110]|uniref:DNA adenine methylase n=1 Tax=Thermoanaerobacterium sp. DL9XJH110 TaxID=3386643 RepID=UPI003BB70473
MGVISPLRYPGGKRKLFKYIKNLIEYNNLRGCVYVEPYAGGAGLALSLLFKDVVNNLILNDIDRSIYAFWYSVLYHTDELCDLIWQTPVNMDQWYIQKEIQRNKYAHNLLSLGFSTLFLNRVNRSGIIKGGVIGGKNQSGKYKIDCRFNKKDLIHRIQKIANYKSKIQVHNLDAIEFINIVVTNLPMNSFIFLDPPYYKKGPELYENHYKHNDHVKLAVEITTKIKQPWIVTYDNVEIIRDLYKDYKQNEFDLNYTANLKYAGKEIMIYSNSVVPIDFKKRVFN